MGATLESRVAQDPFAELLDRQFPSQHTPELAPPRVRNPEVGQVVPVPDPVYRCRHCGSSRAQWVYAPMMRSSVEGWVFHRETLCCPAVDPHHEREAAAAVGSGPAAKLSQAELDRVFVQEGVQRQTFASFDRKASPKLKPVVEALERYAREFDPGTTRQGVFVAGIAGLGKSHLVNALVNEARRLRAPAVSLSLTRLFDLTCPERGETAAERDERNERRRLLRLVPVLALRDFGRHELTAPEVKELGLLLEYREDRGLVTHGTGTETPARLRGRPDWGRQKDAVCALFYRIERLCHPILTCDPAAAPYTAMQARTRESAR
jgi:hypothetical protein